MATGALAEGGSRRGRRQKIEIRCGRENPLMWLRDLVFSSITIGLLLNCCTVSAQQLALDGTWAVGSEKGCSTNPYRLRTDDSVWKFTDQKGRTNVEKIIQGADGIYVTETVSSPDEPVGTRWEYRFNDPSRAEVRNLLKRGSFTIVRCPGPTEEVSRASHFHPEQTLEGPASLPSSAPSAATAEASVEAFLTSIYAPYWLGRMSDLGDARAPADSPERLMEPSLASLWRKSGSITRDGPGPIDGDPICSCQEADISGLQISVRLIDPAEAVATVSFTLGKGSRRLIYQLVAVGGQWRIRDIADSDYPLSLRQILENDLATSSQGKTQDRETVTASVAPLQNGEFARAQSPLCLPYEPETVELTGTVQRTLGYGPPGFGETPDRDTKEIFYSLQLTAPICVSGGDDPDQPAEASIRNLQIAFTRVAFDKTLPGHRVRITGTLFHSTTGHHHTNVLISPNRIEHQ